MISELQLAEFIYEQPALPETEYIFKHALTLEVAYKTLLLDGASCFTIRGGGDRSALPGSAGRSC